MESRTASGINLCQHQDKHPHLRPRDRCTDQVNPANWKCSRNIKILIFVLILAFVGTVITAVVLGVELSKKCPRQGCNHNNPPCPHFWFWYDGTCYYISKEERNWTFSRDFCSSHGASLITITNKDRDFVVRMKGKDSYWISLRKDASHNWKWENGENSTLKVIGSGGDCAYLNDEATASSSRCSTIHHWICQKLSVYMGPDVAWKEEDESQLHR